MDFDAESAELLFHLHAVHDRNEDMFVAVRIETWQPEQHVVLCTTDFEAGHEMDEFGSSLCGCDGRHLNLVVRRVDGEFLGQSVWESSDR